MLTSLRLKNFKCFRDTTIPFRASSVLVGRNNAGKSTIVEALRLVSLIRSRFEHLRFTNPPEWAEIHPKNRGIAPSLEDVDVDFRAIFNQYGDPPAVITAVFSSGAAIEIYLGVEDEEGQIHGVLKDAKGRVAQTASEGKLIGLPHISILPQVAPFNKEEVVLSPAYVQRSVGTARAPLHFRNQINLMYQHYSTFRKIAEETWPGLRIVEFKGRGAKPGDPLFLLVQSEDFVAEVSWMGHGLQMWLQTMWFLARSRPNDIVMLDEPDVDTTDLQRRLIRFLNNKFKQTIVTTHSVEILSEVEPSKILLVDKRHRHARFADSVETLQTAVDRLGATHNLQLSRLWSSRRLLLVEGDDMNILKYMHRVLFPESIDSLGLCTIDRGLGWVELCGGSAMLLENSVGEEIRTYCLLDSDYHTPEEIEERHKDAASKHVSLHIWKRKEIESYLLSPKLIARAITTGACSEVSDEEVSAKIGEISFSLLEEVQDRYGESFLARNREKGSKNANQRARELLRQAMESDPQCINRVPPKTILSTLSMRSKETFGFSFSKQTLLQQLRADDSS